MKKALYLTFGILVAAAVISLQSCGQADTLLKSAIAGQTFDAPTTDFTIPVINGIHQSFISLDSVKLDMNIDSLIRQNSNNRLHIDDADKIVIKSIRLQLIDADQANNWANLDTVNIYLNSNTSNGPSRIATVINSDNYSDVVEGNVNSTINAKDYLKGNQIFYIFYGTNRRATTKELHGKIDVQFVLE